MTVGENREPIIWRKSVHQQLSRFGLPYEEFNYFIQFGLQVDVEWYLSQQVHPPIARLCDPIEGTDSSQV
jgi:hypothetical protein